MNPKDLSQLGTQQKDREINARTEVITKIADEYLKGLMEEEITIGEIRRIANYLQAKISEIIANNEENTFIQKLNGQTKEYIKK